MDKTLPRLYRLLALAFTYPDDDRLRKRMTEVISSIDLKTLQNPRCPLPEFIRVLNGLHAIPWEQFQAEYTRLFINGYPHLPCPPYESAYREGVLLGSPAEAVDQLYRRWGVLVDGEEVDHTAVELEFIAFLLHLETPDAQKAALEFLESHLLVWMPQFAEDVQRAASLEFYRGAGQLLAAVLQRQLSPAMG